MAEKRPPLPEQPLPCPFCGSSPRVLWNGGMTIKCTNQECCQPKTEWWYDVAKCVAQWNRRGLNIGKCQNCGHEHEGPNAGLTGRPAPR